MVFMDELKPITPEEFAGGEQYSEESTGSAGADVRREEREILLEVVRRMMIKGVTEASEIKKQLKALGYERTVRSIYRYVSIIRKRHAKAIEERVGLNKSVEELAFELKQTYDEVNKQAWIEYHRKNKSKVKVKCPNPSCNLEHEVEVNIPINDSAKISALKLIKDIASEHLELMQSLGLVHKEPTKTQLLGADGKPIVSDLDQLNQAFTSFFKTMKQLPVAGSTALKDGKNGS